MLRYRLLYLLILLLLAGCAMGPDYIRPMIMLPTASDNTSAQITLFTALNWWKLFDDPTLDRIEQEALAYNCDLKIAMARVEESRAQARIAFSYRLPAIGIGADAARGRSSQEAAVPGESRTYDSFDAFSFASFEIDIWGKYRRLDEAARAELLATQSARDAVRLSLTADVATLYFHLRTLQAQTRIARTQLETYDRSCDLYRKRYRLGYTQELDLRRIEADRLASEALVYRRENALSQAETALATLLGRSPHDIVKGFSEQGKTLEELNTFPRIPDNIPSDLLARRPDIRRDEGMLIAANARIGAARAAFFPSINLTGHYGVVSSDLHDLFTGCLPGKRLQRPVRSRCWPSMSRRFRKRSVKPETRLLPAQKPCRLLTHPCNVHKPCAESLNFPKSSIPTGISVLLMYWTYIGSHFWPSLSFRKITRVSLTRLLPCAGQWVGAGASRQDLRKRNDQGKLKTG